MTEHNDVKIKKIISLLGLNSPENSYTDPKIMDALLKNSGIDALQLSVYDTSGCLKRLVTERIPITPLFDLIIESMINNSPLNQSLQELYETFHSKPRGPYVTDEMTLHIYVALEVLTYLMSNNRRIEEAIFYAVMHHRHGKKIGSTVNNLIKSALNNKGTIFLKLKEVSVDPGMFIHISSRQYFPLPNAKQLEDFIRKHDLKGLNKSFLIENYKQIKANKNHFFSLSSNILIAMRSEKRITGRGLDNLKAGLALIHYRELYENKESYPIFMHARSTVLRKPAEGFWCDLFSFQVDDDNSLSCVRDMSQEWINLYTSWNVTFILSTLKEARNIGLFTLFVPATFSLDPKTYIANRVDSLWLGMALLNDNYKREFKTNLSSDEWDQILKSLAKNNLDYAQSVLFQNNVDLDAVYNKSFGNHTFLYIYWKIYAVMHGKYLTIEGKD
jgi:hypothetical protein